MCRSPVKQRTSPDIEADDAKPLPEQHEDLAYWRALAEARGQVIRALHEFNYWHEATIARGEVIAGLEESVASWRERCEEAEAELAVARDSLPGPVLLARRGVRVVRRTLRSRTLRPSRSV